jgi:hypothetical protein
MKKIILTEKQLKDLIGLQINEAGVRGTYKEEWNEYDQTLAFFNAKYGVEELGFSKREIAEDIIGTSVASLQKQTANFKYLMGYSGLDRPNKMQQHIYDKYKALSRQSFKNVCLDIIENYSQQPEKQKSTFKLGREIAKKRESNQKERLDALRKKIKDDKLKYDPNKLTLISSKPKNEPEDEIDDFETPKTSIDDVKEFLISIYDKIDTIKSGGDISMLDDLKDDIDFIKDYIESELSPKNNLSESKLKKIIISESQLKFIKKNFTENKSEYQIYHDTYSSAIGEALDYAERRGFKTEGDDVWDNISVGPKKPSEGKTNTITLSLYKDGKEQKKSLQIQVYNMGNKYELNVYIN